MTNAQKHGVLEVGNDGREVIINHPDLLTDKDGNGYITFSPEQSRNLARLLLKNADELDPAGTNGKFLCSKCGRLL